MAARAIAARAATELRPWAMAPLVVWAAPAPEEVVEGAVWVAAEVVAPVVVAGAVVPVVAPVAAPVGAVKVTPYEMYMLKIERK